MATKRKAKSAVVKQTTTEARSVEDREKFKAKISKMCGGGDVSLAAMTIKATPISDSEYHSLIAVHPALQSVLDGL